MAPRFRIALTGGPGGGKTACSVALKRDHPGLVVTAPEVATMLFGGGFPRGGNDVVRKASQRAIYTVQRELETALAAASEQPVLLFDRGTVDASGYWVDGPRAFWKEVNSSPEAEFARYDLVVHLHTPTEDHGYNLDHHTRTESPSQALRVDAALAAAWEGHPHRVFVSSAEDFDHKLERVWKAILDALPPALKPTVAT